MKSFKTILITAIVTIILCILVSILYSYIFTVKHVIKVKNDSISISFNYNVANNINPKNISQTIRFPNRNGVIKFNEVWISKEHKLAGGYIYHWGNEIKIHLLFEHGGELFEYRPNGTYKY